MENVLNALKAAVVHANGHNGRITVVDDGAGNLNLTQAVAGTAGNTTITEGLDNVTVAGFTGGVESTTMNFVMPNVLGSGTKTTTLNIKGY